MRSIWNRRFSAILLALCLCTAALAGCAGTGAGSGGTGKTAVAATEEAAEAAEPEAESAADYITDGDYSRVKAGICVLKDTDTELTEQITEMLTDKGIPEENISTNRDAETSSDVEKNSRQMLEDGTDILFADGGSQDAIKSIADSAARRGKAVIFIGTAPSSDETARWARTDMMRTFYSGPDTSQTAACQTDVLKSLDAEDLDQNKNDKTGMLVVDSDEDVLTKKMKDAGLTADILDSEDAGDSADSASQKVKDALDKYEDDLEVIVCGSDEEALAAVQAVKDADKTPGKDVFVVGAGATDDALHAVSDGTLAGTVYGDTYRQAEEACDAAIGFLSGKGRSGTFLSDEIAVTQSNVQEIIDYKD